MIMENPQCLICAGILSIQGNNIRSHYQTAHERGIQNVQVNGFLRQVLQTFSRKSIDLKVSRVEDN